MDVEAYLARLGYHGPVAPTPEVLRALHLAHLQSVPFENLSIHLAEPIVLDPDLLVAKVVERLRGGFCYELNGAFAALLRAVGFEVDLLAARVFDGERLAPPFDHLALRVRLDEPYLADVGFGDSFQVPLRLDTRTPQVDPAGRFLLVDAGGDLEVRRETDGQWVPQYRFGSEPRALSEFDAMCRYHQTSPQSPFPRNSVCSIATPSGRVTLRGSRLITSTGNDRVERELSDDERRDAYRHHFGITLDALPTR